MAVLPVAPSSTGNGLAMRAASFVAAAERDFDVGVVVVGVGGRSPGWGHRQGSDRVLGTLALGDQRAVTAGLSSLVASQAWRDRLAAAAPFPRLARAASPGHVGELARLVAARLPDGGRGAPVHVMRSYLAPLGLALAEQLGSPWATLDLDDDDEAFARAGGDTPEADAYRRLVAVFAPEFSAVVVASPADAAELGRRHRLPIGVVPNTVAVPERPNRSGDVAPVLLFVGTLGYPPNAEAALVLADEVLPAVRSAGVPEATAWIVGHYDARGPLGRLAAREDLALPGFVEDLSESYRRAAAVVAPLGAGSGTRIKILEAFAHGVPVATTPAGAAGLEVRSGVHFLLGRDPVELAAHAVTLLRDRPRAARLAEAAHDYVGSHHHPGIGEQAVRTMFSAAGGRGVVTGSGGGLTPRAR